MNTYLLSYLNWSDVRKYKLIQAYDYNMAKKALIKHLNSSSLEDIDESSISNETISNETIYT